MRAAWAKLRDTWKDGDGGKPTARIGRTDTHFITSDAMDLMFDEPQGSWSNISAEFPSGKAPVFNPAADLEMRGVLKAYEEIREGAHDPANAGTSWRVGYTPVHIMHTSVLRNFWRRTPTKWNGIWGD